MYESETISDQEYLLRLILVIISYIKYFQNILSKFNLSNKHFSKSIQNRKTRVPSLKWINVISLLYPRGASKRACPTKQQRRGRIISFSGKSVQQGQYFQYVGLDNN